jgi:hypothetical protein
MTRWHLLQVRQCRAVSVSPGSAITVYEKAYSSVELEKLTKLDAMLDARTDKQIAGKQMH